MKKKLLVFLIILGSVFWMGSGFLGYFGYNYLRNMAITEFESRVLIGFSSAGIIDDNLTSEGMELFDVDEILSSDLELSEFRSDWHYNRLNDSEKKIYEIYEYAFEKGYTNIFLPDSLLEGMEYNEDDVLQLFALDSPLLEQNLIRSSVDDFELINYERNLFFGYMETNVNGNYIYVENFSIEDLEKKKEALSAVEDLVEEMPSNLDDYGKCEYLYKTFGEKIEYYKFDEEKEIILYDAVVNNKACCDGMANIYSLALNMADIPCFEVMYSPENEEGHTWNIVKIGEDYYNIDLTEYDISLNVKGEKLFIRIGYSNDLWVYEPHYKEFLPECTENILPFDVDCVTFNSAEINKAVKNIDKSKGYCIIKTKNSVTDSQLQTFCDRLRRDISYITYDVKNYHIYAVLIK